MMKKQALIEKGIDKMKADVDALLNDVKVKEEEYAKRLNSLKNQWLQNNVNVKSHILRREKHSTLRKANGSKRRKPLPPLIPLVENQTRCWRYTIHYHIDYTDEIP